MATPLSTAQLAKLFRTNEKRLSRAFRDLLGYTVSEFVRRERLNQAERMLRTTGLTITQISEELGYSSSANFATAFKSQFGLTPTELRNVNQNQ
ncbi:helix-turn-helix transcriptional regulator [Neopusillimonas aromaticivorans]|uniref:helix-turn-helix transcriptional regulator n=1 Tax=Neopusillimonas aromaticivorans TaxID=2979868 RepID=UPI002597DB5E|nr:helix-turn-helix transcriptional regulator [Neopusillimonas aromaticivorans]WJJ94286.1 helix-turn-helix transcriptional regulator [Neopusillimonas aromaticivorans]